MFKWYQAARVYYAYLQDVHEIAIIREFKDVLQGRKYHHENTVHEQQIVDMSRYMLGISSIL
jgi:hypothetical protein